MYVRARDRFIIFNTNVSFRFIKFLFDNQTLITPVLSFTRTNVNKLSFLYQKNIQMYSYGYDNITALYDI